VKKLLFSIILLGAAVTAGGYVWYQNGRPAQQQPPKTEPVTKGKIVEKVSANGKIAPKDLVIVGIDVPAARIAEVYKGCEVNGKVEKDQELFRLDDTLAQARLKEAESALATAEASKKKAEAGRDTAVAAVNAAQVKLDAASRQVERTKKYIQTNNEPGAKTRLEAEEDQMKIFQEGVANANAAVKEAEAGILAADSLILKAKAGVDVAKKGVEVMTILSPIKGQILEKDKRVRAGQVVSAQMPSLLVIAPEPQQWELYVQVGEYDVHKIRPGMTVEFTVDAYSDDHSVHFTGKVSNIADLPTNQPQARTGDLPAGISGPTFFLVTVDVDKLEEKPAGPMDKPGKPHPLRAGLSANVDFTIKEVGHDKDEKYKVLTIPNAALTYQPENLSKDDQNEITERTNKENNVGTIFVLTDGKEHKVFVRKLATDGSRTAVEPLKDQKLEAGMKVVTEPAPPPPTGGIFSKPLKGVGLN
jgi:HlyD family secretion protein